MPIDCLSRPIGPDGVDVVGVDVDDETRCLHYHTDRDVVAIKFRCCGAYYPCFECHATCSDHECPACGARFNPGCRHHLEEYFAVGERTGSDGESGR